MERLDDEGQWIVLMGVVVAAGMFVLAIIINQAPMVGQSTSEAVLEFPKNEIQDIRYHLAPIAQLNKTTVGLLGPNGFENKTREDMKALSMARNNAVLDFDIDRDTGFEDLFYQYNRLDIHYHNGVTTYDEEYSVPIRL